jgi:hypothetical protein
MLEERTQSTDVTREALEHKALGRFSCDPCVLQRFLLRPLGGPGLVGICSEATHSESQLTQPDTKTSRWSSHPSSTYLSSEERVETRRVPGEISMLTKRLWFFSWSSPCSDSDRAFAPERSPKPTVDTGARRLTRGARAQLWLAFLVVLLAASATWGAGNWIFTAWRWR